MLEKITLIISLVSLLLSATAIFLVIKLNKKITAILKTRNTQSINNSSSDNKAFRKSK